jgi:predicted ATPase
MSCGAFAAATLGLLGYPEQALKTSEAAVALVKEVSHPFSLAYAHSWAATAHQLRRDTVRVQEQAEASMRVSREQGFPQLGAMAEVMQGWVLIETAQGAAGIDHIRAGMADWRTQSSELFKPYWLGLLAEAYGKEGQVSEGLSTVTEAFNVVERTQETFYEAELYRLQGTLALQSQVEGQQSKAEGSFHKAIDVAQRQQAKSLELRATVSLARLWQQQGKTKEAHQKLTEIYNWFTEGFDTRDLQEAKSLLRELG